MKWLSDFVGLFYPRACSVCGATLVGDEHEICTSCLLQLPEAIGVPLPDNFVEKRFYGRIPLAHATSLLIFSRKSNAQRILHQIKYAGDEPLARSMGRMLGNRLAASHLFDDVDLLIPVPLHPRKERQRGYNQSLLLCEGITQTFPRKICSGILIRQRHTDTQTHKNRQQRLENMNGVFTVTNPAVLEDKHVLLVDDVITTGATTEACCSALQTVRGIVISIASLAVAGDT